MLTDPCDIKVTDNTALCTRGENRLLSGFLQKVLKTLADQVSPRGCSKPPPSTCQSCFRMAATPIPQKAQTSELANSKLVTLPQYLQVPHWPPIPDRRNHRQGRMHLESSSAEGEPGATDSQQNNHSSRDPLASGDTGTITGHMMTGESNHLLSTHYTKYFSYSWE